MPWPIRFGPLPRMITAGLVARRDLGLLVVGRVVVRRQRGELGGAGVDGLVDRPDAERVPHAAHDVLGRCRAARRSARRRSRAAWPAAAASGVERRRRRATSRATSLMQQRSGRGTTGRCRSPRAPRSTVAPARSASLHDAAAGRRAATACAASSSALSPGSPAQANDGVRLLQRAQRLLQRLGEVAADRHRLADALHVRGERAGRRPGTSRTRTAAP